MLLAAGGVDNSARAARVVSTMAVMSAASSLTAESPSTAASIPAPTTRRAGAAHGRVAAPDTDREAAERIADVVRARLRADEAGGALATVIADEVRAWDDLAPGRGLPPLEDRADTAHHVGALVSGYGVLQPLFDDPRVEEVWINAPDAVFVAREGRSERVPLTLTAGQVRDLVERLLHTAGRRVDLSLPFVDASLPDGSRLHVVIPDIARTHMAVNIRRFRRSHRSLADLVGDGMLPPALADTLVDAMRSGLSVLVSGATQAGKTTLLGALLGVGAPSTRVVTVEETFELSVEQPDVVALQGRQPSLEGTGEVTLRRLVKEALRMRPDRLVIGEVRDAEALDLVLALNTGVPGAASLHANSAADALVRLNALPLLAGRNIDRSFLAASIARSLDLVVHCRLGADGRRRVVEVAAPTGEVDGERIVVRSLYALPEDTP